MTPQELEQIKTRVMVFAVQSRKELAPIFGEKIYPIFDALIELIERLDGSTKPRIAFAGRFSAGKTTLVNAILGERVLPEGMAETTAIPTRVRYGDALRLFLKSGGSEYYEASEAEQHEFMSLSASNLNSELLKRYVQQQDEAVLEHPNVLTDVEVIDLPGVSSSYQNIEERALMSILFANGIVWVANAKQGGLTRVDIEYLKKEVPAKTPKLIALSHLDLLPPSQRTSVLSSAERDSRNLSNVVGVIGISKGDSIIKFNRWHKFLSLSNKNNRLKSLVKDVVDKLEELQPWLKEETEKQLQKLLSNAELSEERFSEEISEIFDIFIQSVFKINSLVYPTKSGYHIDRVAAGKKGKKEGEKLLKKLEKYVYKHKYIEHLDFESLSEANIKDIKDNLHISNRLISLLYIACETTINYYLYGIYQSAVTLGWQFKTPYNDGDAARAFREFWNWDSIRKVFIESLIAIYRDSVESVKIDLLVNHKLFLLYKEGQELLESGLLDEIG